MFKIDNYRFVCKQNVCLHTNTLTFKLCVLPMCRHQTGQHFRIRLERRHAITVRAVGKCED